MRKFMRTRRELPPAPPQPNGLPHKTNGHAGGCATNGSAGGAALRREDRSTLSSRYWSESEWSGAERGEVEREGGEPWQDPEFPADWRSLGERSAASRLVWRRPHELYARPTFFGHGEGSAGAEPVDPDSEEFAARWAVELGPLGDPSLWCAAGALALTPRLLARVAPPQSPHPARRYRFRFWVWGAWRCVQVDDRLPVRVEEREHGGRLAGAAGAAPDVGLALLEKAYAKLYGSYAALRRGSVARALQDLTGGVVQALPLARTGRALLARVLHSAVPRCTLLVVAGGGGPHCVTGLARARGAGGTPDDTLLVRVRQVSSRSAPLPAPLLAPLSAPDLELLSARTAAEGDAWMTLSAFCGAFGQLQLVHVGPDDWMEEGALRGRRPWRAVLARRRWRRGYNAGGPPGAATAHANPRFHVACAGRTHLVVSLTQQYDVRAAGAGRLQAVGFSVWAVEGDGARVLDVARAVRAREVVTFLALPAGHYLVVPHTRTPHTDHAFLLRILTDERADVWEVNEDNTIVRPIATELEEARAAMTETGYGRACRALGAEDGTSMDAGAVRAALRRGGARCSVELCRALVASRDAALGGTLPAGELPALLALLAYWRHAYRRAAPPARCALRRASSYDLRALLAAAGVKASNKVLECVALRFAPDARLDLDAYCTALAKLHLAHERYRALDAKLKANPLSLEEMILMTIYS